jgi:hypothetical protein
MAYRVFQSGVVSLHENATKSVRVFESGAVSLHENATKSVRVFESGAIVLFEPTSPAYEITGTARIEKTINHTASGTARIAGNTLRTATGNARIEVTQSRTASGNARITVPETYGNTIVTIGERDYSVKYGSLQVQQQTSGRNSTASFAITVGASGIVDFLPTLQSEVTISYKLSGAKIFRGFVTSIDVRQSNDADQVWSIQCVGIESLLTAVVVDETWTAQSDRQIIQSVFAEYLPAISTEDETVDEIAVALDFDAQDITLKQLLENLSDVSGAEWRITEDLELQWKEPGTVIAPFGFSDTPNNDPEDETLPTYRWLVSNRQSSSIEFCNRVIALGGVVDDEELRSVANDTDSQSALGRIVERTVVNRQIGNQAALDLWAAIELERRQATETITFDFHEDGLRAGMLVDIDSATAGVEGTYVIQSLSIKHASKNRFRYTAQVGDYRGGLADRMRQLDRIKGGPVKLPQPTIGTGTIKTNHLDDGAVTALKLAAAAVETSKIAVGAITEAVIAAAAITETKIADNAISTPKLVAGAVTANELAAGSVVAGKIAAGTVVAADIAANTITAAKIVAGTLTATEIANSTITGSKIASSTITGAKIAGGTITGSNIDDATITGAKIVDATITSAKIDSLDASKISAGTISASISITSPNITSTSGSNTVSLTGGQIVVEGSTYEATLNAGFLAITSSGKSMALNSVGIEFNSGLASLGTSSGTGWLRVDGGGSAYGSVFGDGTIDASQRYMINGTQVINSSREFVGAAVSVAGSITATSGGTISTSGNISTSAGTVFSGGNINCNGAYQHGGTSGITSTVNPSTLTSMTIKGGIITAAS